MEHEALQRRSMATIKTMGVNTYSQIVSAFRAQGDLTDQKLDILPVLQNAFGISRERHTAEIKRALYDEQLCEIASNIDPSSNTTNWEAEANYACPTVVHRPPNTKYVQLAEEVLQTTAPTAIIQHPQPIAKAKLNPDLQKLVRAEVKHDGIINTTQLQSHTNTPKFSLPNFTNNDIHGSKVVRLVRAKQTPKRKTSLDTLIEAVQKEILRANNQSSSHSPPSSPYAHTRPIPSTKSSHRPSQTFSTSHRSIPSAMLPSSHPSSLTSQSNHSFKLARKRGFSNLSYSKKSARPRSFNHTDEDNDEFEQSMEDTPENVEEIVREIVDELVALTSLKNAPYVVNMFTTYPGTTDSSANKAQLSKTTPDLRHSLSQTSPIKQTVHHPQLILQPQPTATIAAAANPTLFVAPRILNFQTVVPKPTTNIQIGNTKIILVSPSTTSTSSPAHSLSNNSVKLVKFTTSNSNSVPSNSTTTTATNQNSNSARPTATSTLTLPKTVQIVIPSQTPSAIQLTRTSEETNRATFRPITTVPIGLKTCAIDHIPPAAQEVTIATSPTSSPPPLPTNSNDPHPQTALASIGEYNANSIVRTSPSQDEPVKSVAVNFPLQSTQIPRPTSTHGPMIYRMTSVNPNVPVFRVRTTPTAGSTPAPTPTSSTVMNKSLKTDAKPLSMSTACFEAKPAHSTPTSSGAVSVLACFKTTKKRNKERAIMPRPSAHESSDLATPAPSLNSTTSLILNHDSLHPTNSSPDYQRQSSASSTPTRFYAQTSLSSIHSDDMNISGVNPEQMNDLTTSSSSSIPVTRATPMEFQPIKSSDSFEEKSMHGTKRLMDGEEENWISEGESFLRNVIHNEQFESLDINSQELLRTKIDSIQANLHNGSIPSKEELIQSILQFQSEHSHEHLHSLCTYIGSELARISSESKRLRQQ